MDNSTQTIDIREEDNQFSLKDFFVTCLSKWKWILLSIVVCVGLAVLYIVRQQPVYERTMQLLIQDNESGGSMTDITNAFKSFGLGGGNTNVYNELVSLKSPAVMQEVVDRLNLTVSTSIDKLPHEVTAYGTNAPAEIKRDPEHEYGAVEMKIDLNPDDTYVIRDMVAYDIKGDKVKFDGKTIKGKISFNPINTPIGKFTIAPNGKYTNDRTEPITLDVSVCTQHTAIEVYAAKLSADLADSDSEVIALSMDDTSRERAADVLNTVVDVYNEFWVRDKNRMAVATSEFIDERLQMLIKELNEVDSDIADYQSANHIPDLEQTARMQLEEAAQVNKGMIEATNQLSMAKYVRDYVNNPANANKVVPVLTGVGNTGLEQLVKEYNTLLLTRDNLVANSGTDNPVVETYNTQVNGMRDALIRSVNNYVGTLEANVKSLQSAQGKNMNQLASAPTQAKYLGSIKRDQAIKEQLYLFLLQKKEENDLSKAFNAYNTRIITPPFGSNLPVSPKTPSIIIAAIFMGILIPGVIIYLVYVSDTKIRSRRDLDNLPIPFIGEIPQIGSRKHLRKLLQSKKKRQKDIDTPKIIVAPGKRDVPNEAFRVVRSNIDLMLGRNEDHSIIAVTSFNPGSGKSLVTFNLGASFALKNKRVLLIDGDLRHGSLSNYVGNPTRGLASYLTGKIDDPSRIIYESKECPGVFVIPIGKRPPNPAELLEDNRFGELLDSVRDQYDIIMIDCPPVNIVVDTQLINRFANATLFVVRAGLLERGAIKDVIQLHKDKKLCRMSVLLNGTESSRSSYYSYGNYQSLEE